jgi:hypothetical protein
VYPKCPAGNSRLILTRPSAERAPGAAALQFNGQARTTVAGPATQAAVLIWSRWCEAGRCRRAGALRKDSSHSHHPDSPHIMQSARRCGHRPCSEDASAMRRCSPPPPVPVRCFPASLPQTIVHLVPPPRIVRRFCTLLVTHVRGLLAQAAASS